LDPAQSRRFDDYLSLLLRWNARVNLTAIRDEEGIVPRHFVESIACARSLQSESPPFWISAPAQASPEFPSRSAAGDRVTLAESQGKKAAFLSEAVRVLGVSATVHSGRAEALSAVFDCVTLRAVDRMQMAVQAAAQLVRPGGWLALMTTIADLPALRKRQERS